MKYLLSEFLLEEDAEKFMREHEGCEFVNEYLLGGFLHAAVMQEVWKKIKTGERPDGRSPETFIGFSLTKITSR